MKLSPRFYGPYKVLKCIGPIAYRLDLPPHSKIHIVFYVSCLKKKLGKQALPQQHLSNMTSTGEVRIQPATILDHRIVKRHNQAVVEVLIQWAHMPHKDDTCEPYETIKEGFPNFLVTQS
jgi:hypothetical protein